MAATVWDDVLARVETKVNRYSYYQWFQHTALLEDRGQTLVIRVADPMVVDWLTKHYAVIIDEALAEVGRAGTHLQFQPDGTAAAAPQRPQAAPRPETRPSPPDPDDGPAASEIHGIGGLSPRYSFDTFIVGASNQFAHAACRAVAEAPSRSYNPLFLYGGVGLGKTHLMHAIGHYVLTQSPNLSLTYISAERFMNEVVNAIRFDRIMEFRERYRSVDILLVDDIQFIVGKERTQTEFFHTFNALHDAQKQIVLSSDCPPHQISELEERLRSRFEWGLIADIQPPDLETKIAILKRKAEAEGVTLPDDVALYIANRSKSNIRELEGSLIRLLAYASLKGQDVSMPLVQEALRDVLRHEERAVTIDMIQKFVADYYQLKVTELKSKNKNSSIALPRQVAMYLCKVLTTASLPEIGKSFGGKHHSTVIHSIRKVEEMRQKDTAFNSIVNSLIESFR
ncbi:MAG: chromosomal replication initiator protein DnaA [Acidobacteria bacterium SCN 69-37]|nr:MAG: chromosomal replication initiator protein DnaA [Acidobacteria bacterium SCN 69-37]